MPEFMGFVRDSGRVGIRNDVLVLSLMDNVNGVTNAIASLVSGTTAVPIWYGRGQYGRDQALTERILVALAAHVNTGGVVLVSLEGVTAERIAEATRERGQRVETVVVNRCAGSADAVRDGVEKAARLVVQASRATRVSVGLEDLLLGVECGGSDTTSGLASNPLTGSVADRVVDGGGRVLLSETSEFLGAEHALIPRARSKEVAAGLERIVKKVEEEARKRGVDIRGANPVPDNIAGGLTTIEEKSLGAIQKGGKRTIQDVLEFGAEPARKGLSVMDTPAPAAESLTGLVAAGAQVVIFTTGQNNISGASLAPCIKVCANSKTLAKSDLNIDFDASSMLEESEPLERVAERLFDQLLETCSGRLTISEILRTGVTVIPKIEPTV